VNSYPYPRLLWGACHCNCRSRKEVLLLRLLSPHRRYVNPVTTRHFAVVDWLYKEPYQSFEILKKSKVINWLRRCKKAGTVSATLCSAAVM
jgi:hypothetical protein